MDVVNDISPTERRPITANPAILTLFVLATALTFIFLSSRPGAVAVIHPIDVFTADAFAWIGRSCGVNVAVDGTFVTIVVDDVTKSFRIGFGCDGVLAYLILASTIIPFPCRRSLRLQALLAGLIFIFVINQVRLAGLAAVLFALDDPERFGFYHTFVGQVFAIMMIFFFWSRWATFIVEKNAKCDGERVAS